MSRTLYALLDVDPAASQSDIESAYQRQRARYDTARLADTDDELVRLAAERMRALDDAYATLVDPARRRAYDASIGLGDGPDARVNAREPQTSAAAAAATPQRDGLTARERLYLVGGVLLALLLVGAMWLLTGADETPTMAETSRPAPDITLPTLSGDELQLSDYRGQVVLVNFWGTWCEPCIRETPALQAAYNELEGQGFVVVGVNLTNDEYTRDNTQEDIQSFVEQFAVTYPIALDVDGEAVDAFGVYPLPTSFFIDGDGTIRYVRVGELTRSEVLAMFQELQHTATVQR